MCKRMTYSRILSSLTLLAAVCVLSQGQLENVDMQSATQQLARRFEEIGTVGLGIDSLQVGRWRFMLETVLVIPFYLIETTSIITRSFKEKCF